jgi:hypothetical protein
MGSQEDTVYLLRHIRAKAIKKGVNETMSVVMVEVPPITKTRHKTLQELQQELGDTEHTAILLDDLQAAWNTLDHFIGMFGLERARELLVCESQEQAAFAYFPQVDEE